ncbi:putative tetratricopeptide-like helical domain-containing protein [Medicago truncatula]|uniref:Putative tetratricopeptide-like helical domain-containing protein n=1 Tax=Medicago truncatula TaxID=3880 RepID=A0A396J7Q1_MEDTR|nr:putative tetratricopeptide-like helical domain-containing protein [Medicago truncatula]
MQTKSNLQQHASNKNTFMQKQQTNSHNLVQQSPNTSEPTFPSSFPQNPRNSSSRFLHSHHDSPPLASFIQNLLKFRRDKPTEQIEQALNLIGIHPNNNLVLQVLQRHRSDWKPAFIFFKWVSKTNNYTPSCEVYNEIINILGKMKCFEELHQVLDEMSQRKEFINEETFCILIRRFVAAHKLEEAINIFYRREEFGLDNELDSKAFRTLLMWMCRYKHIEEAETLFHRNLNKFRFCRDIKTWNVILNGWCVLGNTHEAKRLWKDIIAYKCKPDIFTYATFIKAMTKKGKLGTALKLFNGMWKRRVKRIPEALQVFHDMKERDCLPNVATYNSLIKHLFKIRRMEKVYELVEDMERRSGDCLPNGVTYSYLLQSLKAPEEVPAVLERMERNGCAMSDDICNLILRLYMKWDDLDGLRKTWDEMERNGLGPDRRSYTIMIHGHYENGRTKDAMRYFQEMTSKGIVLEPRTEKLVISMNGQLKERTEKQEGVEIEASNV